MDGNLDNQQMKVDLRSADTMVCPDCDKDHFVPRFVIKKVSKIVSPTGKEQYIPLRVYVCANCKTIPDELNPFVDKDNETKLT